MGAGEQGFTHSGWSRKQSKMLLSSVLNKKTSLLNSHHRTPFTWFPWKHLHPLVPTVSLMPLTSWIPWHLLPLPALVKTYYNENLCNNTSGRRKQTYLVHWRSLSNPSQTSIFPLSQELACIRQASSSLEVQAVTQQGTLIWKCHCPGPLF